VVRITSVYDVPPGELIRRTALKLKEMGMTPPDWTKYVKTGVHKERAPEDPDWFYYRSASILRKLYVMGPIGVSRLRNLYGGRKNRGHSPEKFRRGSGSVIRKSLQILEQMGLVRKSKDGGREITPTGKSLLDKIAAEIMKDMPELQKYR